MHEGNRDFWSKIGKSACRSATLAPRNDTIRWKVCSWKGRSLNVWKIVPWMDVDHECGQDFTYVNTLSMDIAFLHRSQSDYRLIISIFVPYIVRSLFPIVASEVKSFFSRCNRGLCLPSRRTNETKPFAGCINSDPWSMIRINYENFFPRRFWLHRWSKIDSYLKKEQRINEDQVGEPTLVANVALMVKVMVKELLL